MRRQDATIAGAVYSKACSARLVDKKGHYPYVVKWAQASETRKREFDDRLLSIQNALKLTMGEVGIIISEVGKHDLFSTEEVS